MNSELLTTISPKTNDERLADWREKLERNAWLSLNRSLDELEKVIDQLNQSFEKKMVVPCA